MLAAFQYLQSEISAVVDHRDEEESMAFRALLSFLLSRPPTPAEPPSIEKMDEDAVMGEADVNMGDAAVIEEELSSVSKSFTNGHNHDAHSENTYEGRAAGVVAISSMEGSGRRTVDGDETHRQRTDVFERLLTFVDPSVKQPRADLVDLIRGGMDS
jgi:muskelin